MKLYHIAGEAVIAVAALKGADALIAALEGVDK